MEWVTEDGLGQVWIGGLNGLNMVDKGGNNDEHIGKAEITGLAEDSEGKIWICTSARGIEILDRTTGLIISLNAKNGLANDSLQTITENKGEFFVAGNGGVDIVDSARQTIRHYGKKEGLSFDLVGNVYRDTNGKIWISNNNSLSEIDVLDEKRGTITYIELNEELKHGANIEDIRQDRKGQIWIVTSAGTVYVIDVVNQTIRQLLNVNDTERRSDMVTHLDSAGNLWIGSIQGVTILNTAQDSIWRISMDEGLASNSVISLNEYAGRIYVGTRGGISVITPVRDLLRIIKLNR